MSERSDTAKSTLPRTKDPKFPSLNQASYVNFSKFLNHFAPHCARIIKLKKDSKLISSTTTLMSG